MNHPPAAFCEVCSEALVLSFYRHARPVDAFTPPAGSLSVCSTQALAFTLSLREPVSHRLTVQWFVDGAAHSGATGSSFALLPQMLGDGSHSITAVVRDDTPLVRNDPESLLRQAVSWQVEIQLASLLLDAPTRLPDGRLAFRVTGAAPQGFVIQTSTDLATWTTVATNGLSAGEFWFTNRAPQIFPAAFFRARTPP